MLHERGEVRLEVGVVPGPRTAVDQHHRRPLPHLVPDGNEMGQRPTVVLVHGGPGAWDHSYFKPDFAPLVEHAQVVYLDLRGHGRSDWGDIATFSFESCADD